MWNQKISTIKKKKSNFFYKLYLALTLPNLDLEYKFIDQNYF